MILNPLVHDRVTAPPIPAFREAARRRGSRHAKTFDMIQAVPRIPTFAPIREALKKELDDPALSFYMPGRGLPELGQAIASSHPLSSHLTPDHLMITAGANQATYLALTLRFAPSDRVLLLEPYYFNNHMALVMLGLEPRSLAPREGAEVLLEPARVIEALRREKARGLILITPNNPTGAAYRANDILEILEYTSRHGIEVILDETYMRFDARHLDNAALAPFVGQGLTLVGSFSKAFSLTGYRVGYIAVNPAEMNDLIKIQDTMLICAPHIGQRAALIGMRSCAEETAEFVARCEEKCARFRREMTASPVARLVSAGAIFAWIHVPIPAPSAMERTLLFYERTGLLGLPGDVFGASQSEYIRLALSNVEGEDVLEAARRCCQMSGA